MNNKNIMKIRFFSKNKFHIIFTLLFMNQTFNMIARNVLYYVAYISAMIIRSSNV